MALLEGHGPQLESNVALGHPDRMTTLTMVAKWRKKKLKKKTFYLRKTLFESFSYMPKLVLCLISHFYISKVFGTSANMGPLEGPILAA